MNGKWSWEWFWTWTIIYIFNLPLVLYIGFVISVDFGRLGIVSALLLLWFLGVALHLATRRFKVAVSIGAMIVAISQFVPIIQIECGLLAVDTFRFATGQDFTRTGINTLFAGFSITVITGQLLFVASLMIGYAAAWFFGTFNLMERADEISSTKQAEGTDAGETSPDFPPPPAS